MAVVGDIRLSYNNHRGTLLHSILNQICYCFLHVQNDGQSIYEVL